MKSTKLFLTTILFFVLGFAQAQNDYNPWKKYGYTPPKALTLSDGKYQEFFDADTVVQIGSVLFNTVTNQVVAFIEYDTAYSEATLEPHVISRWLSPDPLAEEFPSWSPYNFVENNPIKNIDPDGRFPIDIIADLAFIAYDVYDMAKTKMSGGNISKTQYAALGADLAGAVIPYATGLGAAVRAERATTKIVTESAEQIEKKVVKSISKEGDGIVYKRTNPKTTKDYVGQAKSDEHYVKRQNAHNNSKGVKHEYEELGRAKPGKDLDVLEETKIRQGGGPEKKGGKLENQRYQMNDERYKSAGGKEVKPTK
jgi:hypothetical protein